MEVRVFVLAAGIAALAGCAATPQFQVLEARGDKPPMAEALRATHAHLHRNLYDYDSIKDFKVLSSDVQPIRALNFGNNYEEAWLLCVEYNAKNQYGGYTGIKEHGIPMRYVAGQLTVLNPVNWKDYHSGSCS